MPDGEHLDKLQTGLNILIEVKSGLFRGNYLSSVFKVIKNQELFIEIPENQNGDPVKFWPKTLLNLSFFRENEPGAIYVFSEPVVRIEEGGKPSILINFPKKIERIQRRSYVRVDIRMPFYYSKFNEDNTEVIPVEKKGYILDISGGGVFLRTPEKMEKDQMLKT
ncbi:MAG: flagellar brake protein, partial [Candidatus Muiribacteriota bacterium]